MIFVELVEEQGFSPDVLEEEELIKFDVVKHIEVEDEYRIAFLEHRASLHSEDIIQAVEHHRVLLGLLVVHFATVVLGPHEWA